MESGWIHGVAHLVQHVQAMGWVGWLAVVGLYAASCLILVPGSILTIACGTVYGFWGSVTLVIAGHALGSMLCLLATRYLLRDWAAKKLRHYRKVRAVKEVIRREGWRIVFLIRLSPVMPFSLITYALGLTDISLSKFLLAAAVGSFPSTCLYAYLGTLVGSLTKLGSDLHQHRSWEWMLQGIGLVLTFVVTLWVTHLASQALKGRLDRETEGKAPATRR